MQLIGYDSRPSYDELMEWDGRPRADSQKMSEFILGLGEPELRRRQLHAETDIRSHGITFAVYEKNANVDRQWPMDVIPRVIPAKQWSRISEGLEQRLQTLNLFIDDLYHDQRVIKDGVFPRELLQSSKHYLPECHGVRPKFGVWAHIAGTDLVRDVDGTVYVLEDNLRIPSGVSYMMENRLVTKRVFPELFSFAQIQPVSGYISRLYDLLTSLSPADAPYDPTIVVLTPGIYNSAYYEHCFLAQQLGVELVEGQDLLVDSDDCVYMKTVRGLVRVHVIYRRVGDDYLDPETGNPDSALGCRGLFRAWRNGKVALVNAPGAGVADDKLIYSYVPALVRYYLDQDAIIPNVPTYRLFDEKARTHVLSDLSKFVVKPVNESGGYGIVVGNAATDSELKACASNIMLDPRNYVAQPIISLSTAPTLCEKGIEPRHLDLRPFILSGQASYVTRGGLTRVALRSGSLVVNSSQGGGSKDTWIVEN